MQEFNEFVLASLITSMLQDELVATVHNFGDFILIKFPDGRLFKVFCSKVEK